VPRSRAGAGASGQTKRHLYLLTIWETGMGRMGGQAVVFPCWYPAEAVTCMPCTCVLRLTHLTRRGPHSQPLQPYKAAEGLCWCHLRSPSHGQLNALAAARCGLPALLLPPCPRTCVRSMQAWAAGSRWRPCGTEGGKV